MASVNKVILIGNLGKKPETKYLVSGVQLSSFSLATSESYKKGEEWETNTEWHNIKCFDKTAKYVSENLDKGETVYLEGKITHRTWDDDQGNKKYLTEIICNQVKKLTKKESTSNNNQASEEDSCPF